jgi:transcription elongation factor Elf1
MKFNDFVDGVKWHMNNNIPLHESVYRFGSDKYFETFAEARKLYNEGKLTNLHEWDEELLRDTDLGKFVNVKGVGRVPLDMPISEEEHLRFEAANDEQLKGFDPKTAYAIKKLQQKYPHAQDLLSALLGDVEKNELDSDKADINHDNKLVDLSDRISDIENKLKKIIKSNSLKEAQGKKPYVCVHARKGSYECYADTTYGAAKQAAEHWKLPGTAGIDVHLADKEMSFTESEYDGDLHPSVDFTRDDEDGEMNFCYDCNLVSTTIGEVDNEHDEMDVVCPRCGSHAYVVAGQEEIDQYARVSEAEYQGKKVELSKPKRGGSKKFYVYVMNPKTKKVKKVSFGAAGGGGSLAVKLKDPKARKAFADRHNCDQKNDKTKPGYWSCRLPRYAKSLGLSGGGTWW